MAVARIAHGQAQTLARKVEIGHGQVPLGDSTGRTQPSPTEADIRTPCRLPSTRSPPGGGRAGVWGLQWGSRATSEQTQTLAALLTHVSPSWHAYWVISSSCSEA